MNPNQIVGMVEEADGYFKSTYGKVQKLAARYGVNAGLMLMNLARMREFRWVNKVKNTIKNNKKFYADQGIINIILNENPGKICNRILNIFYHFLNNYF